MTGSGRLAINLAFALRRRVLRLLRWPTRGVKVAAFDGAGRLLLVRNGYGRSELWVLPGGGVGRRETSDAAARRELMEEVGCRLSDVRAIGEYRSRAEGKRDTVHLYRGVTADPPRADGVEVIEARFFPLDASPPETSPATLRRIAELRGERESDGTW